MVYEYEVRANFLVCRADSADDLCACVRICLRLPCPS